MKIFRLLFRTIELLWNILEYGDEEQLCNQLNSRVTIRLINSDKNSLFFFHECK